ncbi:MAG: peptidoglycan-binding protein [Proteobacteria bacterium]|nr:peptidoglycan-binding protein [Pseudomonadota bacterium]
MVVDQGMGVRADERSGRAAVRDGSDTPARGFEAAIVALLHRLRACGRRAMAGDPGARVVAGLAAARTWCRLWYLPRASRVNMVAGTAAASIAAAAMAWLIVMAAAPSRPPPPSAAARVTSDALPTGDPTPVGPPVLKRDPTPLPARPPLPPARVSAEPAPAGNASARTSPPLNAAEVLEVQGRLYAFGFDPGPVDGTPGPMTHAAAALYQRYRGLPQNGEIDRILLERLRRDPARQVAARPDLDARRNRSDDPFAPLQRAGDSIMQWFRSIGR